MAGDTKHAKHAMAAVLEDMGRAARERRARRFTKKPAAEPPTVPHQPHLKLPDVMTAPMDVDPDAHDEHGMSSADVDDLARELDVQR
jgi:hypothetical protein